MSRQFLLPFLTLILALSLACTSEMEPPVPAPFTGLDTICTNDWWNRAPNPIHDVKVERDKVLAFGLYTVSKNTMKLSAQLYPLYPDETRTVRLETRSGGQWQEIATAEVNDLGWSALFRIENWDATKDVAYRLRHGKKAMYEGLIRHDPVEKEEIVVAAFSCSSNKDRGDRESYVRNIDFLDPDLIFLAGDQSYDHTEHTASWLLFGSQFGEMWRERPCISIPDDHDVGQPNLWGESGKVSTLDGAADGGYTYHPEYVKMVERCQTANLPDPYDPTPIGQGIGVYYTNLLLGEVDFAIIEDRKFKSGPAGKIPRQGPRPDHIYDPAYDPASIDLPGLVLLGERQLDFLDQWAGWTDGVKMRAVLSQTGFCGAAHLHGNIENRLLADLDSNGWPQTGRKKALRAIKKAHAVHIGGDQHLPTVIRHGIEEFGDGPWAFIVPASVNTYYKRWWWPLDEEPGGNHNPENPLPWTGDYYDGMGNPITMVAYANPESPSQAGGFGVIRFHKSAQEVTFECWPRDVFIPAKGAGQFTGWPVTVQMDPL
ncbi:MAG: hypothetical protein P1P86_14265 [Bacteroidales bacterium]|nr:hypothetical protein [Bacteroidales bacterium]